MDDPGMGGGHRVDLLRGPIRRAVVHEEDVQVWHRAQALGDDGTDVLPLVEGRDHDQGFHGPPSKQATGPPCSRSRPTRSGVLSSMWAGAVKKGPPVRGTPIEDGPPPLTRVVVSFMVLHP